MAFLRGVWSILVGVKDALVLLLLLLLFGGLWALTSLNAPSGALPDGGALRIDLEGTLVDQGADVGLADLLGSAPVVRETEVRDLVRAIDAARTDRAIRLITLDLDGFMGGGQANLEAVADALLRFRAAGKRVESFASAYADDGWFLAAHANRIWMAPQGAVVLTGPGGTGLYFRDALDRLKVNVEVFRVGTYKSFVEPFTRNDRSPEARAADQALAADIWANYRQRAERQRKGLDLDALLGSMAGRLAGANRSPAELDVDWGLVDRLGSRIDFGRTIAKTVGPGDADDDPADYAHIDLADYQALRLHPRRHGPAVALVHVAGTIVDGDVPAGEAGGETIARLIGRAITDPDVKALVVRIDSGGGSVTASEQIRQSLLAARAAGLPVVASFGPVAASGGYWLATGADAIYARPSTITGSIGVFAIIPTFEATLKKFGISTDTVATTPFSGQPDLIGGLNPPMRAFLQAQIRSTYGEFIALVARARRLPPARVEAIAEGRVWSGARARELGLIDGFGDVDSAIAEAARRAGIPGKDVRVKQIRRERPWFWRMLVPTTGDSGRDDGGDAVAKLVRIGQARALAQMEMAGAVAAGPSIQAQCFACATYRPPRAVAGTTAALPALLRKLAAD
jgi:protease-4